MISSIGAVITAIGAVAAAIGAWRSASETRKTSLAQILMQIMDAYSSPEMLGGMIRLRNWQEAHQKDFATKFAEMRNDPDEYAKIKQEDEDRRRYAHHFYKIWRLFGSGLVNKKFVKKVVSHGQVDFLLEIVEPLENAMNPSYELSTFNFFRNLY